MSFRRVRGDAGAVGRKDPEHTGGDDGRRDEGNDDDPDLVEHDTAEQRPEADRAVEGRRDDHPREVADSGWSGMQRPRLK